MSQASGTPSRRLSAAERVERNRQIAEARLAGERWAPIAARHGLSVKQARRCAEEHLATVQDALADLRDVDVDRLMLRIIESHDRALRTATVLLITADNDNARVGAARTVAMVGTSLQVVLLRSGLIADGGLIRFQRELKRAAEVVARLAERHGISLEEVETTLRSIEGDRLGIIEAAA